MSFDLNKQRPQITNIHNFKSTYSPKTRVQIEFPANSPFTQQSFKEECDINTIMAKYMSTGELPNIQERMPQYLDVTGQDFQQQMEFVAQAQSMFEELPSSIRNRFDNDPAQFLDFCSNENNRPELAEMGLLKPEIAQAILDPRPLPQNAPESVPEKTA